MRRHSYQHGQANDGSWCPHQSSNGGAQNDFSLCLEGCTATNMQGNVSVEKPGNGQKHPCQPALAVQSAGHSWSQLPAAAAAALPPECRPCPVGKLTSNVRIRSRKQVRSTSSWTAASPVKSVKYLTSAIDNEHIARVRCLDTSGLARCMSSLQC